MKKTRGILVIGILSIMLLAGANTVTACETGRWTGGGSIIDPTYGRVTHGFELHCNIEKLPNNLEVNWGGNHFHLDTLDYVYCWIDGDPEHPRADCNWIYGEGHGKLNGVSGCYIEFEFSDNGEPGINDHAQIIIFDQYDNPVLEIEGYLTFGNHQAHRSTGFDLK